MALGCCSLFHLLCLRLGILLFSLMLQGFYVFIRAIQLLTKNNTGVVMVTPPPTPFPSHIDRQYLRIWYCAAASHALMLGMLTPTGWPGGALWLWQDCIQRQSEEAHPRSVGMHHPRSTSVHSGAYR